MKEKTSKIFNATQEHAKNDPGFFQKLQAIPRLIKALSSGKYKRSKIHLLLPILGFVYVISPLDFIPEAFLGFFGVFDDMGILGASFYKLSSELTKFLEWESSYMHTNDIIDTEFVVEN